MFSSLAIYASKASIHDHVAVTQSHQLASLPTWGPQFRVSLELYVNSFDNLQNSFDGSNHQLKYGQWAELLRFTTSKHGGSRIPGIFVNKHGYIHMAMAIGNEGYRTKDMRIKEKTWYELELVQHRLAEDDKFYFYIQWNDKVIFRAANMHAYPFHNVTVWSAANNYPPANALIRHLKFENLQTNTEKHKKSDYIDTIDTTTTSTTSTTTTTINSTAGRYLHCR